MIVTNMVQKASMSTEDGMVETAEIPITMTGFLIDVDPIYYYVGVTPDEIVTAIKKKTVNQISLAIDEAVDAFLNEENPNGVVN
jgi:hypothetical protein